MYIVCTNGNATISFTLYDNSDVVGYCDIYINLAPMPCDACGGSGCDPETGEPCPTCGGSGYMPPGW